MINNVRMVFFIILINNRNIRLMLKTFTKTFFVLTMFVFSANASNIHPAVVELLQSNEDIDGIILDIESNDPDFWTKKYFYVENQVTALKEKFPGSDVVILSHGRELKQLTENAKLKEKVKNLLKSVSLNVCSVSSDWQGIDEFQYQENVETVVSAPAERKNYIELGYSVIYLERFTSEQMKQFLIDNHVHQE